MVICPFISKAYILLCSMISGNKHCRMSHVRLTPNMIATATNVRRQVPVMFIRSVFRLRRQRLWWSILLTPTTLFWTLHKCVMQSMSKISVLPQHLLTRKELFKKVLLVQSTKKNQPQMGPQPLVGDEGRGCVVVDKEGAPIWVLLRLHRKDLQDIGVHKCRRDTAPKIF